MDPLVSTGEMTAIGHHHLDAADPMVSTGEMTAVRHRRDTLITTLSGIGVFGLAILTGPLLARSLGATGRGSVAAVIIPTQVLGWLLMFGVPPAAAYYARRLPRRAIVMGSWVLAVLAGVPIVAILWPLVPFVLEQHPPVTVGYFRLFALAALVVLPYTTVIDQLRGAGRVIEFSVYRALPIVLNAIGLAALFVLGMLTLERALLMALLANLVGWLTAIVVNRGMPGRGFDRAVFKKLTGYGSRVWIGTASTMVVARFDQLVMVGLVEPRLLGLYVVAATAAQVTGPIGHGIAHSLLPHLRAHDKSDRGGADDVDAQSQRLRTALGWTLTGSGITAGLMAATAWFLIPLVYGSEFSGAVLALLILLPGQICLDLSTVIAAKLEADNRPGVVSVGTALAAGLAVVATVPAVSIASIEGAAVVTSVSQATLLAFVIWAVGPSTVLPGLRPRPAAPRSPATAAVAATTGRPPNGALVALLVFAPLGLAATAASIGFGFLVGSVDLSPDQLSVLMGLTMAVVLGLLAMTRFTAFMALLLVIRASLDGFKISELGESSILEPSVIVGGVLLLSCVVWLATQAIAGEFRRPSATATWVLAFALIAMVGAFASANAGASAQSALRVLTGALTFVALEQLFAQRPERIRTMLFAVGLSLVVPALFAFEQLINPDEVYVFTEVFRITGTFVHPNAFAAYLVIIAVGAVAVERSLEAPWRGITLGVAGVSVVLTLFTYARGAWIALAVGVLYVVARYHRRMLPAVIALGLVVALLVPGVRQRFSDLGSSPAPQEIGDGSANSLAWRIDYWQRITPLGMENPVTGIGLDQVPTRTIDEAQPHNGFVQAFVETGVLGLGALLLVVWAMYRDLRNGLRRRWSGLGGAVAVGAAAIALGIGLQMVTENLLTQVLIHIYLWVPVAYVSGRLRGESADGAGGVPDDDGARLDVVDHDRPGADHRPIADPALADHQHAGPQFDVVAHHGGAARPVGAVDVAQRRALPKGAAGP